MPGTLVAPSHGTHRALNAVLWIAQVVLAIVFVVSGFMKLGMPIESLSGTMPWVRDVSPLLVRFIGLCEFAGGIGIVVPALTKIRPYLSVAAATCLTLLMATAAIFHFARGELRFLPPPIILGAIAAFVAWGRRGENSPFEPPRAGTPGG
jgi:putative oxidoreductase